MTLAALKNTPKRSATSVPGNYGRGAAVDILYQGGMACLNAAGRVVPAGSATGLSAVLGRIERTVDNSAGAAGDLDVDILPGQFRWDNSGTSIVTADIGELCYAVDDEAVHISNAGGRAIAGTIINVDADGVWVQTLFHVAGLAAASAAAGLTSGPVFYARGASTANIAALATFTVAAVDGLTYVEGERILLKDQAAPAENGVYVVGVVAGGVAPLTRAPEMDDASELVPNMMVRVSEGTAGLDTEWTTTTNATIVVGTTALTFTDAAYVYGLVGAMTAEAIGSVAAAGTANEAARIDHRHAMPASAAPLATGETLVTGAAGTFADSDHVHAEYEKSVRYVMTTDVPDLGAFILLQDGITGVEGDLVLLANQTAPAEAGIYVIGVVAGTAPLTRVASLPAAAVVTGGYTVHVNEGTLFASTNWFIATAGQITIGTTGHTWYPECVTQSATLVAGTVTITTVPILSLTRTQICLTRQVANTSNATDGGYHPTSGGATGLTAGIVGTAALVIEATVLAGTINNADVSTLHVTVINR